MPPPKKPPTLKEKCARAREIVLELERISAARRPLYAEHDQLARELRDVPGLEAHGIRIDRAFAKGNTVFGHGPVSELSIELVEQPAATLALVPKPSKKASAKA